MTTAALWVKSSSLVMVNNSDSLPTGNNSLDAAQLIPNPVTLAGYANTAGEGEEGASRASGDVDDVYAVNALGGEIINLNMSDPNQTDLDLYIYNSAGDLVDYSIGVTQFESSKLLNLKWSSTLGCPMRILKRWG